MSEIDWDDLEEQAFQQQLMQQEGGPFDQLGNVFVPGEGDNPIAFIIGEAPGATEVMKKRPFVGPAGRAQRDLMAIAKLTTESMRVGKPGDWEVVAPNCWLTNVVHFYPPRRNGSRKPLPNEIMNARPFLRREWVAVGSPPLIIPVGGVALHAVTGKPTSILRAAGKCHYATSKEGRKLFVWPMIHPSFGLRTPPVRHLIEKDWENLAAWLTSMASNGVL